MRCRTLDDWQFSCNSLLAGADGVQLVGVDEDSLGKKQRSGTRSPLAVEETLFRTSAFVRHGTVGGLNVVSR